MSMHSVRMRIRSHAWVVIGIIFSLFGLLLLSHLADPLLFRLISLVIQRQPKPTWPAHLTTAGIGFILWGGVLITTDLFLAPHVIEFFQRIRRKINRLEARIELTLSPYISFEAPSPSVLKKSQAVNWVDIGLGTLFLGMAVFMFLSKIQGDYPHIVMGGDAGNIISFAAALDHPEYFSGDALLNDLNNFRIYATVNIPFIRWLNQYTADYGLAFSYLLLPQIFIQLLGFYLLGRVLFKSRLWAFLFTMLVAMPIEINLEETWGITFDPVSRFSYQALIPYLLTLAYLWRAKPGRWIWIMLGAGVLVFVHPVSTPAWGLALWLGFIPFLPIGWSLRKRIGVMFALALLFLVATSPFVVNYLTHHVQGKSADYELVYYIMVNNFTKNLLNQPAAMLVFLTRMFHSGILLPSLLGLLTLWLLLRHDRSTLKLVLLWVLGILLASMLLPWMEQSIERFYRIIPIETELVRSIRYLVFFMLIFCLWPLSELSRRLKSPPARAIVIACGILITGLWMTAHHPNLNVLSKTVDCLSQGYLVCVSLSDDATLIEAIKEKTPQDARFFTSVANRFELTFGLAIRSVGLRSLVYTYKDRAMMVFSNNQALEQWLETYNNIGHIDDVHVGDYPEQFRQYLELAISLGADHLVIDFPPPPDVLQKYPLELIYQNSKYTLYKIDPPP